MARAVRGVRRRWREEHHPRNPNSGEFVRKGSPEAAAWAVRLSEKAGEHRGRMAELHPSDGSRQRWAGLLSDKAEQQLTPEQHQSVERLQKKGAPVSVLPPVGSDQPVKPRFKTGDLITNGSRVGTVIERVERGPHGQGPGVRIQNISLERFGGNRGMSSFVPDTRSGGWEKMTLGEWKPVKGGGLEERFVWSSDHSHLQREVRSTALPKPTQAPGSKPITHSDLWRTTPDPDKTRAEGLKLAQVGWEGGGSYFGEGVYLHTSKADSDRFAEGERRFGVGRAEQLPAQASVSNPFVVTARPGDRDARAVMQRALEGAGVVKPGERVSVQEFTRRLKERGHDGVEVRGAEGNDHLAGNQLVVFDAADASIRPDDSGSGVDRERGVGFNGGRTPPQEGSTPGGTQMETSELGRPLRQREIWRGKQITIVTRDGKQVTGNVAEWGTQRRTLIVDGKRQQIPRHQIATIHEVAAPNSVTETPAVREPVEIRTVGQNPKDAGDWVDRRTGAKVDRPSQVDIVRGNVVKDSPTARVQREGIGAATTDDLKALVADPDAPAHQKTQARAEINRRGAKPKTAARPGKKIPARGAPAGYEVRDQGDTDYAGKPVYQVYGPDGNKVGTLTKTEQTTQIRARSGNISVGSRTRKGYRFAPGDTLPTSGSSLRPTVADAIDDYHRGIKPHLDKYRGMSDDELAAARTRMAGQYNTFHANLIGSVQRERRRA
jgi:hypothetical protein